MISLEYNKKMISLEYNKKMISLAQQIRAQNLQNI